MKKEIKIGLKHTEKHIVEPHESAKTYGSGLLEVYATPAMIAFIEKTCMNAIIPSIEEGFGTVGISVDVKHVKATPIGDTVTCVAEVVEKNGNKITFSVNVNDEKGLIGTGTHKRYIINNEDFMKNLMK